ncbi:MAG: hypothetical protein GXY65_14255 [Rhodococcus sp.]|nr:hypothetical protein [Rhodococcus sp. (in: high G+C Gram-positive bacteria)]
MALVTTDHDALLADLRVLADTVLDRIEGIVAQIADPAVPHAAHDGDPDGAETRTRPDGASCAWCPICALAALIRGENHELLTRLAAQIAALIAMIRELLARLLPAASGDTGGPDVPPPAAPPDGGGFERIAVTIRP